jgi:esterase/lipase superfamily enzyme
VPSRGDWWKYGTDRASADKAADSLAAFLAMVEAATGAETIHLVAHSMGNRVLLPALARIARDEKGPVRPRVGEVILAAPAVPLAEFVAWIDELSGRGVTGFTLYASAVDRAMHAGYVREGGMVLAGSVSSGQPLLHVHVQSIDVSEAGATGLVTLNHDVFASNPVMTEDMRQLLQRRQRPPSARLPALEPRTARSQPGTYWYYRAPAP